jgi:hypothetical protein
MSLSLENIIGLDQGLLNRIDSFNDNQSTLLGANRFFRRTLNPLIIRSSVIVFLINCLLALYSFVAFFNIISFGLGCFVAIFYTFLMFNVNLLLYSGIFGPSKQFDIIDSNSIIISYVIKYVVLSILGVLFSVVVPAALFYQTPLENYCLNTDSTPGIVGLLIELPKIGGFYFGISFLIILVIFLFPQIILDFKLDKRRVKSISRELQQEQLRKIYEEEDNSLDRYKTEWQQKHLARFSNDVLFGKTQISRNIAEKMFDYLNEKHI